MPAALPLVLLLLAPSEDSAKEQGQRELKFGIDVAKRGLWSEARFRFEKAVSLDSDSPQALNNLAVALEQQGDFKNARAAYEKALKLKADDIYIQQNYDLFREADDKRNRKAKKKPAPQNP
jgi:Flp pilus assembly protein TadD